MRVALVLGGGGARGFAHVGVLRFLEEQGFVPHIICGSSIGAIIGGKYALVPSWRVLWEHINRALESEAFERASSEFVESSEKGNPFQEFWSIISKGLAYSRALTTCSLVSLDNYMAAFREFFPHDPLIEHTRIPFAAVAVDLVSGREVILTRGSMVKAVAASSSIPGVFPPIRWLGEMLLVDGGWVDVLPALAAYLLGADVTIGVWVGKDISVYQEVKNAFDVVYRADEIARHYLNWLRRRECTFIIEPDVGRYMWNEFDRREEILQRGYEAAERTWPEIVKILKSPFRSFLIRKPDLEEISSVFCPAFPLDEGWDSI